MAILNKDGSVYKLTRPNPLMDNQDNWDFILHNISPIEETYEDKRRTAILELNYDTISSEPIPEPPVLDKLIAWCLPATVKERHDPLYGEIHRSISYGERFSFETVIIERKDIFCQFWAPLQDLSKESIIYLWKEREWWKVTEVEKQENGVLFSCVISDKKPSFSA